MNLLQAHGGYTASGELLGVPILTTALQPNSDFNIPRATFAQCVQQIYSDLNASNPEWKKIYPDWSKFLADQNAWFRFTEGTFDRFMQQQKL